MFFPVTSKNLNWEILTKNLAAFKRRDGVKDEKFLYHGGFTEKSDFRGGVTKNQYIGGNCLRWESEQFSDLRGAWQKRGDGVFEEGGGLITKCKL